MGREKASESNTQSEDSTKKFVTSTTKDVDIVMWDGEGKTLLFSSDDFKQLSDTFLAQLSEENRERYLDALAGSRGKKVNKTISIVNPVTDIHSNRLKLEPRDGYHRTWIEGSSVESFKALGYKVLMKVDKEGKSTGEVIRIPERNPNGSKSELIAMEVPEHVYKRNMEAQRLTSQMAVDYNLESFRNAAEDHNRRHGGKGKKVSVRAGIVDPEDPDAPIQE